MEHATLRMRHYQSCCRDGLTGWIAPLTAFFFFVSLHGGLLQKLTKASVLGKPDLRRLKPTDQVGFPRDLSPTPPIPGVNLYYHN
jgi:hypothetical protein